MRQAGIPTSSILRRTRTPGPRRDPHRPAGSRPTPPPGGVTLPGFALRTPRPVADRPHGRWSGLRAGHPVRPQHGDARWNDTSFGILIPNIRDAFHLSNAGILSVVAVAAVVGLSLQVPIAQMADRHNRVRLMLLGATIFAGFVFGTGLAIVAWMLVLMQSGAGVGKATVGPTHNPLIADWYPIDFAATGLQLPLRLQRRGCLRRPDPGRPAGRLVRVAGTVHRALRSDGDPGPPRPAPEGAQPGDAGADGHGLSADALLTEEPPPSFAEGWRMVWKVESLRRIFFALPFLAASIWWVSPHWPRCSTSRSSDSTSSTGLGRGRGRAGPARRPGHRRPCRSKLIIAQPGLIIRFLAVVAACRRGLLVLFALVPILWVTIVVNMAVTASLAAIGAGIFGSLSLGHPGPRPGPWASPWAPSG